jgi:site-specific DNA-methyltransferase (adenine-specific)
MLYELYRQECTAEDTCTKEFQEWAMTRQRARKYIPHLARFSFKPTYDWSVEEASELYATTGTPSSNMQLDHVFFEDCVSGMGRLPNECIDLVIADPPFGIDFDGKSTAYNRDSDYVLGGYEEIQGSYSDFTRKWMHELPRILKPDGSVYVFSGWTNLEDVLRSGREEGLTLLNHIIWHYPFGVYTRKRLVTSHYHILLFVKDSHSYFFNKFEHYPEDVWRIKRPYRVAQTKNGTRLPLKVVCRCIDFSSTPGDIVLDPFMGNGTTGVAAKSNWRHFIGFEINEQMKPIIEKELQTVRPGEAYQPYFERLPTTEELAKTYPKAHKQFLRGTSDSESSSTRSIG